MNRGTRGDMECLQTLKAMPNRGLRETELFTMLNRDPRENGMVNISNCKPNRDFRLKSMFTSHKGNVKSSAKINTGNTV